MSAYENVKIQSLYGSSNGVSNKAAVSRAVRLLECPLKCHNDQKIISFFPSDSESVFAYHLTGKVLSFEFYPKAIYFERKFSISRSAITHVQS